MANAMRASLYEAEINLCEKNQHRSIGATLVSCQR